MVNQPRVEAVEESTEADSEGMLKVELTGFPARMDTKGDTKQGVRADSEVFRLEQLEGWSSHLLFRR